MGKLMETLSILERVLPVDIIMTHILPYTYRCQPADLLEDVRDFYTTNTTLLTLYRDHGLTNGAIRREIKMYCACTMEVSYPDLCFQSFSYGKPNIYRFLRIFLASLSVQSRKHFLFWQRLRVE